MADELYVIRIRTNGDYCSEKCEHLDCGEYSERGRSCTLFSVGELWGYTANYRCNACKATTGGLTPQKMED